MTIEFEPESAPNTVHNFLKLAERGAYDGQRFYCVFKGHMILAGDPAGTGTGDVGYTIPYESGRAFHAPGSLAMDRLPPGPNSGSRFFIDLRDQKHLDGNYTVFGRISEGLDVAQRIGATPAKPNGGRPAPLEDVVIEQIVVSKKKQAQPPKETKKE
jgi:peptidyl-prolyl cis-trans isomerase B (cyclophilin B)